nr:uncharacterized protein LOC109147056 [Ipomoea trifida]
MAKNGLPKMMETNESSSMSKRTKSQGITVCGNGLLSTNIWRDLYLLDSNRPFIETPTLAQLAHEIVVSLIVLEEDVWDEDILQDILIEEDAKRVARIPVY